MKRALNIHLREAEYAWLKGFAAHEGTTMVAILRDQIRDSMRRELAMAGIEAGIRCSWAFCFARPAGAGSDRPDLCPGHGVLAAENAARVALAAEAGLPTIDDMVGILKKPRRRRKAKR